MASFIEPSPDSISRLLLSCAGYFYRYRFSRLNYERQNSRPLFLPGLNQEQYAESIFCESDFQLHLLNKSQILYSHCKTLNLSYQLQSPRFQQKLEPFARPPGLNQGHFFHQASIKSRVRARKSRPRPLVFTRPHLRKQGAQKADAAKPRISSDRRNPFRQV